MGVGGARRVGSRLVAAVHHRATVDVDILLRDDCILNCFSIVSYNHLYFNDVFVTFGFLDSRRYPPRAAPPFPDSIFHLISIKPLTTTRKMCYNSPIRRHIEAVITRRS